MAKGQIGLRLSDEMLADLDRLSESIVPNLKLDRTQLIEMAIKDLLAKHAAAANKADPKKRASK